MPSIDDHLVDQVYAASLVPEIWPSVIDALSDRLQGRGGSLFMLSDGQMTWTAPPSTRAIMEAYDVGGWGKTNVRLDRLLAANHPGFLLDIDLFATAEFDALPIRREFLLPHDIAATAATVIKGAGNDLAVLSIDRGKAPGSFSLQDVAWLDALRPHLARAVALSSRLRMREAATAAATLQMLGIPGAVLSDQHRVMATNPLFDALAGTIVLPAAFGLLALTDRRADRLLRAALLKASGQHACVRSIAVRDRQDEPAGIFHVVPARRQAADIIGSGMTLLIFAQPSTNVSVAVDLLWQLYDLTPAEARIGSELAGGFCIKEISAQAGTSEHTVKSHVKSLLRKTGFRRQVDFVRAVSSLSSIRPLVAAN